MAYIEDGIRALLLSLPAVTAITTRVRTQVLDENDELPAVLISLENEDRDSDFSGYAGLTHLTCQVMALSKEHAECRALSEAIRGSAGTPGLEGFDGTAGGVTFHVESIPNRVFLQQPLQDGSKDYWRAISLVCRIGYSELTYG